MIKRSVGKRFSPSPLEGEGWDEGYVVQHLEYSYRLHQPLTRSASDLSLKGRGQYEKKPPENPGAFKFTVVEA
jgi:hypothetical protein